MTHEERRHIASGLAEGLGYAEIARRLGRPTSTVSREVARNGGSGGYRADRAHRATARRARRHGTAPARGTPVARDAHGRDPRVARAFAERLAGLMVRTGLPRMAARVLACLVTTDSGALTAAELVRRLEVSSASVSKAVGYLEGLEVVRRERDPRRRRERYVIDDDVWLRTWLTSARTNAMWAAAARRGAEVLGVTTPAGARLEHMALFFARLSADMSGGSSAAAAADDALTVLAALVQAGAPLTADRLAAALGWPPGRVAAALHEGERHPEITDPLVLRRTAPGLYAAGARPERLTTRQRHALRRP
ncbi:hypothetical protein GCM10023085_08850 [Actinomadura viridis]|uniref:DNA-binding transcriptional regulator GbsR (MarR family) n=1 Tax=Actinomadura viridis TaxID=58110 RepID=A0A931GQM3_9ACTN|nr:DNA-binding transcriptional regulator GbsR (MarR family) [Actinomadura viridis]